MLKRDKLIQNQDPDRENFMESSMAEGLSVVKILSKYPSSSFDTILPPAAAQCTLSSLSSLFWCIFSRSRFKSRRAAIKGSISWFFWVSVPRSWSPVPALSLLWLAARRGWLGSLWLRQVCFSVCVSKIWWVGLFYIVTSRCDRIKTTSLRRASPFYIAGVASCLQWHSSTSPRHFMRPGKSEFTQNGTFEETDLFLNNFGAVA